MFDFTYLFCIIDDFFQKIEPTYWDFLKHSKKRFRVRSSQLKVSEVVFIAIWYKCSHFNNFKAFFLSLKQNYGDLFQYLPCYQRMVCLINAHQLALHALHFALMSDCHSIYLWIDSTILLVCKNQRIGRHQSIKPIATRGMSLMGWFYGCKLHLIMNKSGDIVSTTLSNSHTADIKMVEQLVKRLNAKTLCGSWLH